MKYSKFNLIFIGISTLSGLLLGLPKEFLFTFPYDNYLYLISFLVCNGILFRNILLKKHIPPKEIWTDPILILTGRGLDLYEFSEKLENDLYTLYRKTQSIAQEIRNLNEIIDKAYGDMERIFQVVTRLASQEVSLMDTVGSTSGEIQFMFDVVNSVISEIDSRNENMKNLVNRSRYGGEKVQKTNSIIQQISEKSDYMLRMVDFINKITKETNLLAINAAIEASHSDKEGKGFAIIADEMKKLATQIGEQAKEITKVMKENIENFKEAHLASLESGEAFHAIASEIHIISGTIAEVVQTIQELKNRGNIVLATAKELDSTAEAVKNTSGEVYGDIVEMNNLLSSITDLSSRIKADIEVIEKLQKENRKLNEKIKNLVIEINQETDKFLGVLKQT